MLSDAAALLKAADLTPFYMAALTRRAAYVSDAAALDAVEEWCCREGVVQLNAVTATLAPGAFRTSQAQGLRGS